MWNLKQFEMIDKYRLMMQNMESKSEKPTKKVTIEYNKLKGISAGIKGIMIERFYDQCRLIYSIKFFEWRLKYKEIYLDNEGLDDLHDMLSVDRRKELISQSDREFMRSNTFENDTFISQVRDNPSSDSATKSPKKVKKEGDASPKKKKRKLASLKKNNASSIYDMISISSKKIVNLDNFSSSCHKYKINSLATSDIQINRAYLAFPPQMKFVPTPEQLQLLISNATKYRYEKNVPKIYTSM